MHLLAGINPRGIAQAPYRPVFTHSLDLSALNQKLGLAKWAQVFSSPSISAYIGGDITSGLLATEVYHRKGTVIFIDIGTNGEIVLSKDGQLMATSCAAGPALEGMNIICGQRATTGAVDSFSLSETGKIKYSTIGEAQATGICGSGLIDLCAELIKAEFINPSGRMTDSKKISQLTLKEGRFYLSDSVFLDQKDIRQIQLAKGAIRAAITMLLEHLEVNEEAIDEIVIAGSFGFHLKAESLKTIGLIPKDYGGKVTFVGNSSLAGSARMILDRKSSLELSKLVKKVEVIELGFDPKFQEVFLKSLAF
jgi:uncharacterized 2Fe-2S/4Fe-4S cluster protein (DUF4445 family)